MMNIWYYQLVLYILKKIIRTRNTLIYYAILYIYIYKYTFHKILAPINPARYD